MIFTDDQVLAEFDELVTYSRPRHRQDVELFHAQIARKTFSAHVHDGYIFGIVEQGSERFQYRGTVQVASPADLILLTPDEIHTAESAQPQGVTYSTLFVSTETMHNLMGGAMHFPDPVVRAPEVAAQLHAVMRAVSTHADPLMYDSLVESVVDDVVSRFGRALPCQDRLTTDIPRLVDITDFVDANLDQLLQVEDLAKIANLSRFHFIRRFRQATGVTPIAFVQARRTVMAKKLLTAGLPPALVAVQTGFSDQSHMNRWLKACYGITSKMYKRAI